MIDSKTRVSARRIVAGGFGLVVFSLLVQAQRPAPPQRPSSLEEGAPISLRTNTSDASQANPNYVIGVGDELNVWVSDVEELSGKTLVVDRTGAVTLPFVGSLHVDGLTVLELENQVKDKLKVYVRNPEVGISLIQTKNEAVSVAGSVNRPGVYQLTGKGTLVDMVMEAGGLRPEAGPFAEIMRPLTSGPIPLPTAKPDTTGKYSVARVNLRAMVMLRTANENFVLKAGDRVSVPEAEMVYVLGDVNKPGAFPVNGPEEMTALQALALAGGTLRTAAPEAAKVLRRGSGETKPTLLGVNLKALFKGKTADFQLQPNDVVYVPPSARKAAANRAVEAAIQTGLLALTYHVMY